METECVTVDGNEAVYGGTITEALNVPEFLADWFSAGSHVYFRVIDNGQGNNAPPDQMDAVIFIFPYSLCGEVTPSSDMWSFFNLDVLDPGSVKVNN